MGDGDGEARVAGCFLGVEGCVGVADGLGAYVVFNVPEHALGSKAWALLVAHRAHANRADPAHHSAKPIPSPPSPPCTLRLHLCHMQTVLAALHGPEISSGYHRVLCCRLPSMMSIHSFHDAWIAT
eukprot:134382-Pleurochrysis_carterae.AAC.2